MSDPVFVRTIIFALVAGYLAGSVPFGLLLTRLAGTPDLRSVGSGNIGATNVLRTGRRDLAAATLVLDALKGTFAIIACTYFLAPAPAPADLATGVPLAAAGGAFLGHIFPVWLRFRGGKGVATFLGCLAGLFWPAAVGFALVWLVSAALTRYSSLAALVASALTPGLCLAFGQFPVAGLTLAMTMLLWWRHRDNIRRLLRGTEGRIGRGAAL